MVVANPKLIRSKPSRHNQSSPCTQSAQPVVQDVVRRIPGWSLGAEPVSPGSAEDEAIADGIMARRPVAGVPPP